MKSKLVNFGIVAFLGAFTVASFAFAQDASSTTPNPLEATCGTSVAANAITWTAEASGGVTPYRFLWSGDSGISGSTSTSITAIYAANGTYAATVQVTDASSSVASATCSAVVSSFSTSTPPTHTQANLPPQLQVGPSGSFLARDLIVQSIGTNSFTGSVWGVTYTIDTASSTTGGGIGFGFEPEFFLRGGENGGAFNLGQLQVGDQLGVSGSVASSSPRVVDATVIRNYSITTVRPIHMPGGGNGNGNGLQARLDAILKQFQDLQSFFHFHFGGGR